VFSDFAELSDEKFNALQVVAFYDIWPGNGVGLFSKETMSKGGDKQGKSEEKKDKWGSIRYKQANSIYSAEIKKGIKGALLPETRMVSF